MSYYWYGTLSFLIFISFFFLYLDRIKRNWTNAFWVISTTNLNNINGFNRYKIYCVNGVNFFECAETEFCSTVNLISHRISATAAFSNQICNIRILTHTHTHVHAHTFNCDSWFRSHNNKINQSATTSLDRHTSTWNKHAKRHIQTSWKWNLQLFCHFILINMAVANWRSQNIAFLFIQIVYLNLMLWLIWNGMKSSY